MFMSFINWPYCFFFFIKDDRSYLIFLESLLTISLTSHSSNYFSKLEDTSNKTCLFNTVSFIKKSIISFIHFLIFIFKIRNNFFFINFLISSNFFKILHHLNMINMVAK